MKNNLIKILLCILFACMSAFFVTACNFGDLTNNGNVGSNQNNSQTGEENNDEADNGNAGNNDPTEITGEVVVDGITYSISNGVATIEDCESSVTSVNIPKSITYQNYNFTVTTIEKDAFRDCDELTSVVIPDSVTSMGDYAFSSCDSLTSIEIPDSITSIAKYAFYNCSSLTSVVIPDSVTSIGENAFSDCTSLQYNIKDSLKYLGNEINKYLYLVGVVSKNITAVDIDGNCKFIGDGAFYGCASLRNVVTPDSVTSIGDSAFGSCTSLTSVVIGSSVTSVGVFAFSYCDLLKRVDYTGTIDQWAQIKFVSFDSNPLSYGYGNNLYINGELVTEIKLTTATLVSDYAFYNCDSLTSVEIGNSVTRIGEMAFENCFSLTKVVIGDSVTNISDGAFYWCDLLTSVVMGNSVTSIGWDAFWFCTSLTSITFNGTVAEWNSMSKGSNWNYDVPATKVICADGEVEI